MAKYQKYAEYKYSGIDWLGEIPNHWNVGNLKFSFVGIKNGATETQIEESNNTVPISRIESISTGEINYEKVGFVNKYSIAESYKINEGDILLSHINSLSMVGNIALKRDTSILYHGMNLLRLMPNKDKFDPKYLFWILKSKYFRNSVESIAKPAINQASVSIDSLKNISLLIPTKIEQQDIANFLDHETSKIDHLIEKQQQLIELLKEKPQAVISHAVTKGLNPNVPMKDSGVEWLGEVPQNWTATKIGFHALKIGSGKTPKGGAEIYQDEGVLFIRSQNVYNDGLRVDNSESVYISEAIYDEMFTSKIYSGDILLNITGGSIGRSSLVPDKFPEANVNQHVCIIRVRKYLQEFLALVIQSDLIQAQLRSIQTGGNREGLNFEQISKFWFVLPPKDEQEQIILFIKNKLNEFGKLEARANKAIQLMQERRTALISAAVTGKIDVRHWQSPTVAEADTELSA